MSKNEEIKNRIINYLNTFEVNVKELKVIEQMMYRAEEVVDHNSIIDVRHSTYKGNEIIDFVVN